MNFKTTNGLGADKQNADLIENSGNTSFRKSFDQSPSRSFRGSGVFKAKKHKKVKSEFQIGYASVDSEDEKAV
jgi:hypothetical protein